jgi:hypothetical protein
LRAQDTARDPREGEDAAAAAAAVSSSSSAWKQKKTKKKLKVSRGTDVCVEQWFASSFSCSPTHI